MLLWWQFFSCGGHQTNFDICTMLNSMSNSLFSKKINKIIWKLGWNTFYLVATIWVLFPNLLSLVSNSSSCWKFMQLHEKMVKIHHIWWPLDGFCSLAIWVWCQIQIFVENLCKLHEKMVKICLILLVTRCVLASPRVLNKSKIKVKVQNDLNMCFII